MKCPKCGYDHSRKVCPYCLRAEKWQKLPLQKKLPGLPTRMYIELEEDYELEHQIDAEKAYFCFGSANTGKTVFAVYTMYKKAKKAYIENRTFSYEFVPLTELFDQIISRKKDREFYKNLDYLVIDDLGVEHNNDALYGILYSIVDYRYNWMKQTTFTSNLSPAEIKDKLQDERLVRRIIASCDVLKFKEIHYE